MDTFLGSKHNLHFLMNVLKKSARCGSKLRTERSKPIGSVFRECNTTISSRNT